MPIFTQEFRRIASTIQKIKNSSYYGGYTSRDPSRRTEWMNGFVNCNVYGRCRSEGQCRCSCRYSVIFCDIRRAQPAART